MFTWLIAVSEFSEQLGLKMNAAKTQMIIFRNKNLKTLSSNDLDVMIGCYMLILVVLWESCVRIMLAVLWGSWG